MPLRQKVMMVHCVTILGGILSLGLAAALMTPIPGLVWLAAGGLAAALTRCPKCGKSVFKVERRRTMGFSIGYSQFWAERVCSRCGSTLFEDASHTPGG